MRAALLKLSRLFAALLIPLTLATAAGSAQAIDLFGGSGQPCASGTTATSGTVCKNYTQDKATTTNPVITALKVTIDILSVIIGFSAVFAIMLAGFNFLMSQGDSQKVAKARTAIILACVGLAITAMAQLIVGFVLNKL